MASNTPSPLSFIVLCSLLTIATSTFNPNTKYFLNCGATDNVTFSSDNPSRVFVPDSGYLSGNSISLSAKAGNASTSTATLYDTARAFTSPATYRFSLSSSGIYVVRLHFFAFSVNDHDLFAAHFSISSLNGLILLPDFSLKGKNSPVIKEYFISVDGQELEITFTPIGNSLAFVNAIEVFNAPADLNIEGPTKGITIEDSNHRTFETAYRLNVGGKLVTPQNDTLWRTWRPDEEFLSIESASAISRVGPSQVKYTEAGYTDLVAPQSVYDSARTLNVTEYDKTVGNLDFNVTWNFTVDANEEYLIRLHFCDFISPGYEDTIFFDIYVGNESAKNLQSRQFTDVLSEVFYMDFGVIAPSTGPLFVSIGSSDKTTNTQTANAYLNGLEMFRVNDDSIGQAQNPGKSKSGLIIIVGSVVGGGIVISSLVILCLFMCKKRNRLKPEPSPLTPQKSAASPSPRQGAGNSVTLFNKSSDGSPGTSLLSNQNFELQIPLLTIKAATDDFDDSLIVGTGGFGKVYKGVLPDGTTVAVKRGSNQSQQGYPAFKAEIDILSQVRHKHLVSLIGYCDEQGERILVYEYMEKGTLRSSLYGSTENPSLSWKQRLEICIGAAKGLHYLHTGLPHSFIHRDVKSTNILLGENYIAKVSDFGLSKHGPSYSKTHVTTGVKGTFGYMDPQYVKTQKLSEKSDVYSFGVMLFEVLCARPVIEQGGTEEQVSLSEWALQWQKRGQLEKIIDEKLVGKVNMNSLRKFGEIAEKCLAEFGDDRPTFGDVLWNLEYVLQLQQTQVMRGPLDDSQVDASQISIQIGASVEANEVTIDEENVSSEMATIATHQEIMRIHLGHSTTTESSVFSQLNIGEAR